MQTRTHNLIKCTPDLMTSLNADHNSENHKMQTKPQDKTKCRSEFRTSLNAEKNT